MNNPIEEQKKAIAFFDDLRLGAKVNRFSREAATFNAQHAREKLMLMRNAEVKVSMCCVVCSKYWDGQCQLLAVNVEQNWMCKHFDLYKED